MHTVAFRSKACVIPVQGDSRGASCVLNLLPTVGRSRCMDRAFSARQSLLAINLGLAPQAGMSDAVGVDTLRPCAFSR
jgi:hypothetical protein